MLKMPPTTDIKSEKLHDSMSTTSCIEQTYRQKRQTNQTITSSSISEIAIITNITSGSCVKLSSTTETCCGKCFVC